MILDYNRIRIGLICLVFIAVFAYAGTKTDSLNTARNPDRWLAADKAHHFTSSAVLTGLSYYAARQEAGWTHEQATRTAIGFSISIGIGKEVHDKYNQGVPSFKDVFADVLGVAAGLLIIQATTE